MKKYIAAAALMLVLFNACVKKVDVVDGNYASVTLVNAGTNYVTEDKTVNPKDSIFFSFTITSDKEMGFVSIQKNPTNQTAFLARDTMTSASRHSYTAVKKFAADSVNGTFIYRIVAHDTAGVYIGSKDILVTTKADFTFWSYRFLYAPDSVTKTNKCYFSTSDGKSYSYSDGAAISNLIDFGYFYDTTKVLAGTPTPTLQPKGHTIYALTNTITPFLPYDLSAWTKNATLLKGSSLTNLSTITSAGAIRTACIPALNSGPVTRFSQTDRGTQTLISTLLTSQVLLFKTVTGKYGLLTVSFTNNNGPNKDSYINIDVKLEK
jgi:hypothetical protein